ncbi:MAG: hypothetical protein ACPG5T_08440, partial [Endozoicomonas sp.]
LRDFESALTQQNVELYFMQNNNIIKSEVDHEFLKLKENTELSKTSEYKINFVNTLIEKSKKINKLIQNTACQEFQQLTIFKQLVTAYANQSEMDTSGFSTFSFIPKWPSPLRTSGEMTKIDKKQYKRLKVAIWVELSNISSQGQSYLLHKLEYPHLNCTLKTCHDAADAIPMSTACPLHYIYIQLLHELEQYYDQHNVVSAPPPSSS